MLCVTEVIDASADESLALPLFESRVQAGFPSPADDYIETCLDLNDYVVRHPASTFFLRVEGDSMKEARIFSGDLVVVDRSLEPRDSDIVIAAVGGELTVKRLRVAGRRILLQPENDAYPVLEITEEMDLVIWGVVTHVLGTLR